MHFYFVCIGFSVGQVSPFLSNELLLFMICLSFLHTLSPSVSILFDLVVSDLVLARAPNRVFVVYVILAVSCAWLSAPDVSVLALCLILFVLSLWSSVLCARIDNDVICIVSRRVTL